MVKNQLPEGVGKKIVEALKRQSETVINPIDETVSVSNDISLTEQTDDFEQQEQIEMPIENEEQENLIVENYTESTEKQTLQYQQPVLNQEISYQYQTQPVVENYTSFNMPTNVCVLKNLIAQLPTGVSKQTGAQIIRQTIEALGISMGSVLKEAQDVQNNLSVSIKEASAKVQEYKINILQLERQIQEHQKQSSQINDLISLFILTDKRK